MSCTEAKIICVLVLNQMDEGSATDLPQSDALWLANTKGIIDGTVCDLALPSVHKDQLIQESTAKTISVNGTHAEPALHHSSGWCYHQSWRLHES